MLELHAQPLAVESDGVVEVLDRHSDVINASEHGGESRPQDVDLISERGQDARGGNYQMPISIENPDFDEPRDRDGFRAKRAGIGRQAGAVKLGASLWELPPGEAAYPYHFHLGEEEMIVTLVGTPTLRSPDGERELAQGEVVVFLRGEQGAHQLMNRTDEPVRFLAISTSDAPDVVVYPDSGKIGCYERRREGGGLRELHLSENAVDYWDGESAPG
jgi:uncharacterized cupin superfamily protein